MSFTRSYPVGNSANTFIQGMGQALNSHNINAGKGIKLRHTSQGIEISNGMKHRRDPMVWQNIYNPNQEYFPNDEVYVPDYINYTGSVGEILHLTAGTYVCINYVPPAENNTASFAACVTAYGQQVADDFANSFRFYQFNNYYPSNVDAAPAPISTTYGAYNIIASQSFWQPIGGSGQGVTWAQFNESSSYSVGTIVWVEPNATYVSCSFISASNNTLPLVPGSFLVCKAVPAASGSTLSNYPLTGSGRVSGNVYYPTYPMIPAQYQRMYSGSIRNDTFYEPISPMLVTQQCVNNQLQTVYIGGVISGSVFHTSSLPYPIP